MWDCPCVISMCPGPFVGELGLMWMQPRLSSGCAGSCHFGKGARLEMEKLELELAVSTSLLSGCHRPVRGRACSPVAGVEALRVRLELTLRPLKCVFSLLPTLGFLFQRKRLLKQVGLMYSDHSSICSLSQKHATISSLLLLWPPEIQCSAVAWSEWGWNAPLLGLGHAAR